MSNPKSSNATHKPNEAFNRTSRLVKPRKESPAVRRIALITIVIRRFHQLLRNGHAGGISWDNRELSRTNAIPAVVSQVVPATTISRARASWRSLNRYPVISDRCWSRRLRSPHSARTTVSALVWIAVVVFAFVISVSMPSGVCSVSLSLATGSWCSTR